MKRGVVVGEVGVLDGCMRRTDDFDCGAPDVIARLAAELRQKFEHLSRMCEEAAVQERCERCLDSVRWDEEKDGAYTYGMSRNLSNRQIGLVREQVQSRAVDLRMDHVQLNKIIRGEVGSVEIDGLLEYPDVPFSKTCKIPLAELFGAVREVLGVVEFLLYPRVSVHHHGQRAGIRKESCELFSLSAAAFEHCLDTLLTMKRTTECRSKQYAAWFTSFMKSIERSLGELPEVVPCWGILFDNARDELKSIVDRKSKQCAVMCEHEFNAAKTHIHKGRNVLGAEQETPQCYKHSNTHTGNNAGGNELTPELNTKNTSKRKRDMYPEEETPVCNTLSIPNGRGVGDSDQTRESITHGANTVKPVSSEVPNPRTKVRVSPSGQLKPKEMCAAVSPKKKDVGNIQTGSPDKGLIQQKPTLAPLVTKDLGKKTSNPCTEKRKAGKSTEIDSTTARSAALARMTKARAKYDWLYKKTGKQISKLCSAVVSGRHCRNSQCSKDHEIPCFIGECIGLRISGSCKFARNCRFRASHDGITADRQRQCRNMITMGYCNSGSNCKYEGTHVYCSWFYNTFIHKRSGSRSPISGRKKARYSVANERGLAVQ
mmetsp:Transcript_42991/g.69044  ORF Transcript_42991/g.69044 Transcript_42991/m.69044 type:complete len:599 (+) Transcript_42991:46-1842(+)